MLKIKNVTIPDLRRDGALDQYAKDLGEAFADVAASLGDPIEEQTKVAILDQIVRWSWEGSESFPSWKMAVWAANNAVTQGTVLGPARMPEARQRGEAKFTMAME